LNKYVLLDAAIPLGASGFWIIVIGFIFTTPCISGHGKGTSKAHQVEDQHVQAPNLNFKQSGAAAKAEP
jgi:hypothetical protein